LTQRDIHVAQRETNDMQIDIYVTQRDILGTKRHTRDRDIYFTQRDIGDKEKYTLHKQTYT